MTERAYWQKCWQNAWAVMPRHSATLLLTLIGSYKVRGSTVYVNWARGSKPRDPTAAKRLEALASPHGRAIAKAKARKRGVEFK